MPGRRYFRSVYELVREAALVLGRDGGVFSDADVIRYIRSKYPDCPYSDNSFRMHLYGLSINNKHAPKRWPNLYKRAFLLQLRSNKFKLSETTLKTESTDMEQYKPILEIQDIGYSLSLERDLEDFLSNNLGVLEEGLKLIERQKELPGIGRLDILAKDKNGNYVVIELKAGEANEKAIGQLLAYIEYLKEKGYKNIRGILVAASYTTKAIYAVKAIEYIKLAKYSIEFKIEYI